MTHKPKLGEKSRRDVKSYKHQVLVASVGAKAFAMFGADSQSTAVAKINFVISSSGINCGVPHLACDFPEVLRKSRIGVRASARVPILASVKKICLPGRYR